MASFMEEVEEEIPVYYESLDSKCEAYPMETEAPEDGLPSYFPAMFRFKFQVFITHVPYDDEAGECFPEKAKCAKKEHVLFAERDGLSRQLVWDLLEGIGVPVEHYMVLTILDCAEMMIKDERTKDKKLLHMFVDMDVPGSGEEEGLVYYPLDHQW